MTANGKIQSFTDLETWQVGHEFVLMVYRETTSFPDEEKFGLKSQIRRAAGSITHNIAEGFVRSGRQDKVRFYDTSRSSLAELQDQLLIARDLGYIEPDTFKQLADESVRVRKLLNGLRSSAVER